MPKRPDIVDLLAQISLTSKLSEMQLQQLADQCQLIPVEPNWRIYRRDLHALRLFLADGHALCRYDGVERQIDSCLGLSAPVELFEHEGSDDDLVLADTTCLLLRLPVYALEALEPDTALEVSDIELDDAESDFLRELYELIDANCLELPARPEVALQIQQLTRDPEVGIDELTKLIQSDGTVAGALLHTTNSPIFRAAKEISSVRDAVIRIGFDNTRKLATNLALRQAFTARRKECRDAMLKVWNESAHCAIFSQILSNELKLLNPERALLAGLISNIGAVPIIRFLDKRPEYAGTVKLNEMVAKLQGIIGVLVISYWGLGADMIKVAENSNNWSYRAAEPDYASIALVARWATAREEGLEYPSASEVPAFEVLKLSIPEEGQGIIEIENNATALKELRRVFGLKND
ncbi:HDOD domain-containing protein [Halochromatium roseum]|uniref:HDOD domain-containing protein n=1 Tax=Halochromatium roseum TaxID=391920 RepID=UPI0019114D6C|nr:HDOD domain-containing protein [Halochromatium roseum]MBK5939576.1 histidine kinase [Halochromatium roseum]